MKTIALTAKALVGLALLAFLALVAWNLLVNFWALGLAGIGIVCLFGFALYSLGSEDEPATTPQRQLPPATKES